MFQCRENPINFIGDMGEVLASDLISSPIRRVINRDAEREGIDLRNPRRSVASLLGSCGMGVALGAVLGPPGGILGCLFGYVVALGSAFEGDRPEYAQDEEAAIYIRELKAFQIAVETTQNLVTKEIWAEICEEIDYEFEGLSKMPELPESLDDAVDLIFEVVGESVKQVDFEAYLEFFTAYEEAKWKLGL
jgi:hypothetical protein